MNTVARSQFETSIAKHGPVVVVGYNDTKSPALGNHKHGTSLSRSTDHGRTFTKIVSSSGGSSLPDTTNGDGSDPVVIVNPDNGYFYMLCNRMPSDAGIQVFRSTDSGATFSLLSSSLNLANSIMDKPHAVIDPYNGTGKGNFYVAALQASEVVGAPTAGIYFNRSVNGGSTWSTPVLIAQRRQPTVPVGESAGVQGTWVVVGPDHSVYVFWLDQSTGPAFAPANGRYYIAMRKSTNQGVSFGPRINVVELTDPPSYLLGENCDMGLFNRLAVGDRSFKSNAWPQAVANPKNANQLFLTFATIGLFTNDKADVYLAMSNDGGTTWTTSPSLWTSNPTGWKSAARLNNDSSSTDQWMPSIAIHPDGKKLFVGFYDRRDNLDQYAAPLYTTVHAYGAVVNILASSFSVQANLKLTDTPFLPIYNYLGNPQNEGAADPTVNPIKNGYWGSYDGVTVDKDFFYYSHSYHAEPAYPYSGPNVRIAKVFVPEQYQITDLGTLGGYYSVGRGLNNFGDVTGYAQGAVTNWTGNLNEKGFLYSGGILLDMVNPGGPSYDPYVNYYGNAVNDGATIAGHSNYGDYYIDPYRWTIGGGYQYLSGIPGNYNTRALAINNAGAVAGYGYNGSGLVRGAYWAAGSTAVVDLQGFLQSSTDESVAYGVNAQNRVVGKSKLLINGFTYWHGFNLLNPAAGSVLNSTHDIGTYSTLNTHFSEARAINASGFVVGGSGPSTSAYTPFIKAPNTAKNQGFSSLGFLPGGNHALALAINANNRVVGYGNSGSGSKAFIYPEAAHNIIALDGLLSAADQAQWQLITAEGVNDNRQVTGWGYHNGVARAYLLTPIP